MKHISTTLAYGRGIPMIYTSLKRRLQAGALVAALTAGALLAAPGTAAAEAAPGRQPAAASAQTAAGLPPAGSADRSAAAQAAQARLDALFPPVGSALVAAGGGEWNEAAADLATFAGLWGEAKAQADPAHAGLAGEVDAALEAASSALAAGGGPAARQALSTLAGAVDAYASAAAAPGGEETAAAGPKAAAGLLPAAGQARDAARAADWDAAEAAYRSLVDGWAPVERAVRQDNAAVYGQLETKMSLLRIALQAEPVRAEAALAEAEALRGLLESYSKGLKPSAAETEVGRSSAASIEGLIGHLDQAITDAEAGRAAEAAASVERFIADWPSVEGRVQISSPSAYTRLENESAEAAGYLLSDPPKLDRALATMKTTRDELAPLSGEARYTFWDAALVLLREGLEAILVLAAMLAFARRSGRPAAARWVWSGAAAGLAASLALASGLTLLVASAAAGGAREAIEGYVGLAAVVMMLAVGRWLHGKSGTAAWNRYVGSRMEGALAGGSLWTVFGVTLLAVLREGAETAIFYAGMAPSMDLSQMLLGIVLALALLGAAGYAILALSARLPIGAFFRTAALLIYYLVFRFLGESIHALQVAGHAPAHVSDSLPVVGWLGLYPTWETAIPQAALLLLLFGESLLRRRAERARRTAADASQARSLDPGA